MQLEVMLKINTYRYAEWYFIPELYHLQHLVGNGIMNKFEQSMIIMRINL